MKNTTSAETTTKTRKVAGHTFTLASGVIYHASRPMASRGTKTFPVTITERSPFGKVVATVPGLTYDQSNRLINAFNNGAMSFDGRTWK